MAKVLGGLFAVLLALALVLPVLATTAHCPDGWVSKTETGDMNGVILDVGTQFCVKGSTDATGIIVADGQTSLVDYLDNGHDVSYYVIYGGTQPSPTPSPSLTPSPSPSPTSIPSSSPSPEPSPSLSPTTEPSSTPQPSSSPTSSPTSSPVPTATPAPTHSSSPAPTLPATDTEG